MFHCALIEHTAGQGMLSCICRSLEKCKTGQHRMYTQHLVLATNAEGIVA